jgi:hypothetical protein
MIAGVLVLAAVSSAIAATFYFDAPARPARTPAAGDAAAPPPTVTLAVTSNAYARPARTSDLVAIIPEGRVGRLTGRSEDNEWLRVIYPPSSSIEGWVPSANAVAATLPSLATVPVVEQAEDASIGASGATGATAPLPDLTVSSAEVQPNGALRVQITNAGRATFTGKVGLRVTDTDGATIGTLEVDLTQSSVAAGRSASVSTGFTIKTTGLFTIDVDHEQRVAEANDANNSRRVLLVGVGG